MHDDIVVFSASDLRRTLSSMSNFNGHLLFQADRLSCSYLNPPGGTNFTLPVFSVGAKSQILSSVAPPRKKNVATIFSQGHVLGPRKPMFY